MCEIIRVKKHLSYCCNLGFYFFHAKEAGGEVGEVFLPLSRRAELRVAY